MTTKKTTLAEAITNYCESNEATNDYKKTIFANCANLLNQTIVEAKEKQALEAIQLPASSLLRNYIPWDAVMRLGTIEAIAVVLIEDKGMEPFEAVERACFLIPPIS